MFYNIFYTIGLMLNISLIASGINLEIVFENYKNEPKVQDVLAQALKNINREQKEINSWKNRVRTAAWLPTFKAGVGKNNNEIIAIRQRLGEEKIFNNKSFGNWDFETKAEWDFEKLLFRKEEIDIQNQKIKLLGEKQNLIENITEAYFERRKFQIILDKLSHKKKDLQKLKLKIEIQKYAAYLDAMTDGWFSAQI